MCYQIICSIRSLWLTFIIDYHTRIWFSWGGTCDNSSAARGAGEGKKTNEGSSTLRSPGVTKEGSSMLHSPGAVP